MNRPFLDTGPDRSPSRGRKVDDAKAILSVAGVGPWVLAVSPRRTSLPVLVRRAAALTLRSEGWSYPEIGRVLGRHHTSIMSLVKGPGQMRGAR